MHDIGQRLVERGHRVDLVTGQPSGVTSRDRVDGIGVRYVRTPLPGPLARRGLQREGAFGAVVLGVTAVARADLIACYHYADAALAVKRGRPLVLKLTGTVPRDRVQGNRVERELLERALGRADEVWVNSAYAVEAMAGWDREMLIVPAGLDDRTFVPSAPRSEQVTVLCASTPDEPRKRVADLVDAWPAIRDALPGARLLLAGAASERTRATMLGRLPHAQRAEVSFLGVLHGAALARAYSAAHVMVMPAVHEAFGLVTLEALACGTPVAGARSGATPELLGLPGCGALFAPTDVESCAESVVEAVATGSRPGSGEVCRAAALRWAWPGVVEEVESRFRKLLGPSR